MEQAREETQGTERQTMTLIDKAEALEICESYGAAGEAIADEIAALPARGVGVKPVVDAVEALNAACDAMWNDHHRLEGNPSLFGQEMRIKEKHVKAITEAQQRLRAILAALEPALAPTDAAQARECCDLCGSDVTDMDGHLVHDEGCNGETYEPAAQPREAALLEAWNVVWEAKTLFDAKNALHALVGNYKNDK